MKGAYVAHMAVAWSIALFLSGSAVWFVSQHRPQPEPMQLGEAQAQAAKLTNHLMICWGDPTGWECAKNDDVYGPVVTCLAGRCQLSSAPVTPVATWNGSVDGTTTKRVDLVVERAETYRSVTVRDSLGATWFTSSVTP